MRQRTTVIVLLGSLLPVVAACGGRLYKVAPLPSSAPPEISASKGAELDIGAVALDGERSYERFEANLPLAGVIAVDVRMVNKSEAPVMTNSLRFELRNGSGAPLKRLTAKKALGVVMKYYGDKFYANVAYRRTLEDYESVAFKQGAAIEPEAELRGMVFFLTQRETTNVDGFILSVAGLNAPVNVQLQTAHN